VPPPTTIPPTTMAPPPTVAPPPTFEEAKGKAAASMRAAQAAFKDGNYDKAIAAGQKALQEDPANKDAQRIVENSLNGQKAESHLRAAESALAKGDFPAASNEADQARGFAPWDGRVTSLLGRIRDAQRDVQLAEQQKAQQEEQQKVKKSAGQLTAYLSKATDQLSANNYDAAIALYDEALKLDPGNAAATQGKIAAIGSKKIAEAGASRPAVSGKGFVANKTAATSPDSGEGSVPTGFSDSAGVTVKKGTVSAELPGKITFEVAPATPKPGDTYTVSVYMGNEGTQPISLRDMIVTTTINGRKYSGPVPPQAKDIAPSQKALLTQTKEVWKEDTSSWSMEAIVHTARGETYRNQVVWK
jgi:tetratricopeptide (TPR) repeat protein